MVDATGTSTHTYNAASEITSLSTPQGSINYTYNLAGQIATMVDVGTGTTTHTYDTAGRPSSVTDPFGDVSTVVYDTAGRVSQKNNPNGTYETYTYDSRNRVTSIVTKNSANSVLQSRTYTFDLASQVTAVVEGGIAKTYGYDAIGQLTSESKTSGYSASYSYDANGNRLTRTVNGSTENYTYDPGDKLTAITGGSDPRTYAYDAAGRTTGIIRSSGTTAFSYDFESRVTSITKPGMTTNSFTYNGLDTRVSLTDSSGSKTFKRDGVYVTDPVLSDGSATFTPSGEVRGSTKTTFHSGLKNDDIQTNASQAIGAAKLFDAFGNELSTTGSWQSKFSYAGKFGYQTDSDSGLKLLGHRYYDPSTGRFLTRDPIKDGRNWYTYCANNPISNADPEGFAIQIGVGAAIIVIAAILITIAWTSRTAKFDKAKERDRDLRKKDNQAMQAILEDDGTGDSEQYLNGDNRGQTVRENARGATEIGLDELRGNYLGAGYGAIGKGAASGTLILGDMFGRVGAYIDDLTSAGDIKVYIDGLVKAGKLSKEAADELLKDWKNKKTSNEPHGNYNNPTPLPIHY